MKWIGITGSWRETNPRIEADVRNLVRKIILSGNGIVTGGALNVDWFATDEALKWNSDVTLIKVCLPTKLQLYLAHYRKRAEEGVITHGQADSLEQQLTRLYAANPISLIEHPTNICVDQKSYYERNSNVVELSDEVVGFQVNKSKGVQDTINKARAEGKPVQLREYKIDESELHERAA